MKKDISIIEWYQLPAPKERYLLVRFMDEGEIHSEVAYSVDGIEFLGDTGEKFYAPVEAWAYLPYDVPSNPENEKLETLLKLRLTPEELANIDNL